MVIAHEHIGWVGEGLEKRAWLALRDPKWE